LFYFSFVALKNAAQAIFPMEYANAAAWAIALEKKV